jgi:hypothetical protein
MTEVAVRRPSSVSLTMFAAVAEAGGLKANEAVNGMQRRDGTLKINATVRT